MSNKENVVRIKCNIPKLVDRVNSKDHRDPLKCLPAAQLNQQDQAGPSGIKKEVRQPARVEKEPPVSQNNPECQPGPSGSNPSRNNLNLDGDGDIRLPDMRHVTARRGDYERVDKWRYDLYKVFNDIDEVKASMPSLAGASASAPTEVLLTPKLDAPAQGKSTQKKVKRSLKRAHTKDLQSFASPTMKAVKKENQAQERAASAGHEWPPVYAEDYIGDNLNYLLAIEKQLRLRNTMGRTSRCCIVNWIVNVNGSNGYPAVVQLACWYLDSYLSKVAVPLERLQLVAASCYWIATKVHGVGVTSTRLERWSGFAFTKHDLSAMEIHVLCTLDFPLTPCVVHDFVPYLCAWCRDASGALASGAAFMALCVALVYKFGSESPPSVVAAACVRCTLRLTGDCSGIARLETCPIYKAAVRKSRDFRDVTVLVRNAVRTVTSRTFEYKAPFNKYAGPPHYVALKITEAVNNPKLLKEDQRWKACTGYSELV